jgi:hypothetical protein
MEIMGKLGWVGLQNFVVFRLLASRLDPWTHRSCKLGMSPGPLARLSRLFRCQCYKKIWGDIYDDGV